MHLYIGYSHNKTPFRIDVSAVAFFKITTLHVNALKNKLKKQPHIVCIYMQDINPSITLQKITLKY